MKLHSGSPYWLLKHGLVTVVPALQQDETCDVGVIGSGIVGALIASALVDRGFDVVILDRRDVAQGSTVASTALVQYELDVSLTALRGLVERERADHAYALGAGAVGELAGICRSVGCAAMPRLSVYFTRKRSDLDVLAAEMDARRSMGLEVEWAGASVLWERFGLKAAGGIVSRAAAEIDPYALTHALWRHCRARGARLYDRTRVRAVEETGAGVVLHTARGPVVRAAYVVHATGYEAALCLPPGLARLNTTYAFASEPVGLRGGGDMIWEYAPNYVYARWDGGRLLAGGLDEPYGLTSPSECGLEGKTADLVRTMRELMPALEIEPAYAWCGSFASTADGLGFICPAAPGSRRLIALGFGGNGVTLGVIARRMIVELIVNGFSRDEDLFSLYRTSAAQWPRPADAGS